MLILFSFNKGLQALWGQLFFFQEQKKKNPQSESIDSRAGR